MDGYIVTNSAVYDNRHAWKTVAQRGLTTMTGLPGYVNITLPKKVLLTKLSYVADNDAHNLCIGMRNYIIYGSNDNFTTLIELCSGTAPESINTIDISINADTSYKYYRITATSVYNDTSGNGMWYFRYWQLYGYETESIDYLSTEFTLTKSGQSQNYKTMNHVAGGSLTISGNGASQTTSDPNYTHVYSEYIDITDFSTLTITYSFSWNNYSNIAYSRTYFYLQDTGGNTVALTNVTRTGGSGSVNNNVDIDVSNILGNVRLYIQCVDCYETSTTTVTALRLSK